MKWGSHYSVPVVIFWQRWWKKSIINNYWNVSGSLFQFVCDKCPTYCDSNRNYTNYVCGYKYVLATLGACFNPCQAACAIMSLIVGPKTYHNNYYLSPQAWTIFFYELIVMVIAGHQVFLFSHSYWRVQYLFEDGHKWRMWQEILYLGGTNERGTVCSTTAKWLLIWQRSLQYNCFQYMKVGCHGSPVGQNHHFYVLYTVTKLLLRYMTFFICYFS